jgi:hypothetical protein
VGEITGFDVQAAIYSTATGRLLVYDETELADEWMRLATLSPDKLRVEVSPDDA